MLFIESKVLNKTCQKMILTIKNVKNVKIVTTHVTIAQMLAWLIYQGGHLQRKNHLTMMM